MIYASTFYVKRRELWNNLDALQDQCSLPWWFIGDFNTILGGHKHKCMFSPPPRVPMEDFQNWSDNHNLLHIPTKGASFTWSNSRSGNRNTNKRFDRVVCNQALIDHCTTITCSTLLRHKSDHYPFGS